MQKSCGTSIWRRGFHPLIGPRRDLMKMKSLQPLTSSLESRMKARLNQRVVLRGLQPKLRWSLISPLLRSRCSDKLWLKESGAPILEKLVAELLVLLSTTPSQTSHMNEVHKWGGGPQCE
nr:14kDa-protein [Grapevine rupestris stem pitting-associated virus]BDX29310.1 14kDa-protein [Grapevine rupestris stem pitting-associated virus]BDX29322.1 14kDa-protein [Grapevine rupestris stem pitting-associated virus]